MEFEIKKGEPIPEGRVVGITATMRKLAVGDSFVIDGPGEHTRKGLYSIAKKLGIAITTRKLNGSIQIWRIADKVKKPKAKPIRKASEKSKDDKLAELRAMMDSNADPREVAQAIDDSLELPEAGREIVDIDVA